MCEWGTTTILPTPDWLWSSRAAPENGVAIDACISGTIAQAWERGVRTLGSCCGHGNQPPSVVLTEDQDLVDLARSALPGWTLEQWRLVDVSASE